MWYENGFLFGVVCVLNGFLFIFSINFVSNSNRNFCEQRKTYIANIEEEIWKYMYKGASIHSNIFHQIFLCDIFGPKSNGQRIIKCLCIFVCLGSSRITGFTIILMKANTFCDEMKNKNEYSFTGPWEPIEMNLLNRINLYMPINLNC